MRVLISASTFPIRLDDGLPRFVYDLAEALAARCEVTALVPDAPGAARRERMGAVDVERFTYFWPRRLQALAYGHGIGDNLRASFAAKLQPPPFVVRQALATRALARRRGAEIVNSHWLLPQGLSTALARGRRRRFGHVVTLHGGDAYLLSRMPFGRSLARFVLGRADAVFAVSTNVRDALDQALGRPSNAVIQPVGVHVAAFRGAGGPASPFPDGHLLFVGRLIDIKGVPTLLRALPAVLERHPGVGLLVVGYGPRERELAREAECLGVAHAVRFAGRRTHAEIAGLLATCRAAVVPSIVQEGGRAEGMPSVVLEALAAGARVVASRAGGIPDAVRHGENGWLFRPGEPADLAQKLLAALADDPASGVTKRARETAERLDWARVADRYVEAFERIRPSAPRGTA